MKIKIFEYNEFLSRLEKECKGGEVMEIKTKVRIMAIIIVVVAVLIDTAAAYSNGMTKQDFICYSCF